MRKLLPLTLLALTMAAPEPKLPPASLIEALLQLPIEPPPQPAPLPFADPGADAPIEELLPYWGVIAAKHLTPGPSQRVLDRLLTHCEQSPKDLPLLLPLFQDDSPANQANHNRIHAIWEKNKTSLDMVPGFLRTFSRHHFRDERIAMARQARDKEYWVDKGEELEAMARLDMEEVQGLAEPILLEHTRNSRAEPRTAAFALAQLYRSAVRRHAPVEKVEAYRAQLRAIVEDRTYPGRGRDYAAKALLRTKWEGWTQWHRDRFADPTLRDLRDGSLMMNPLCNFEGEQTEEYITTLAALVGNANRNVHDAAVTCLVSFHLENARRDALLPLLPWLHDPKWSSSSDRLRLIQSIDRLDLRESIPGLIAVLGQEGDEYARSYAAESLAHFRDPRAVPALRAALLKEKDSQHRQRIIQGLVACGGVSDAEAAAALEAIARLRTSESGRQRFSEGVFALDESIGLYLSFHSTPPTDAVIQKLLMRADALRKSQPTVAAEIGTLLARWDSPAIARDFASKLKDGKATAEAINLAMRKRESLVAVVGDQLRTLATGGRGAPAGIACALLGAPHNISNTILSAHDEAAQAALLATARLGQIALPVDAIQRLLLNTRTKGILRTAAVAYLEAVDTADFRRVLYALHAGEAHISGNRSPGDPGHSTSPEFDAHEASLQKLVRSANGPDRVWALLTSGYWGGAGQLIVQLRGNAGKVSFEPDAARYVERDLQPAEIARLREFLTRNKVEKLGPLETNASDGIQVEFVELTRDGGYRVFMNNPQFRSGSVYAQLCDLFRGLLQAPGFQIRYRMAESVRDFRILNSAKGTASPIHALWKPGAHLLALRPKEGDAKVPKTPTWNRWTGTDWAEDDTPFLLQWPPDFQMREGFNSRPWTLSDPEGKQRFAVGAWKDQHGLWSLTQAESNEPQLLLKGELAGPVVAERGEWIVIAQAADGGGMWAQPNGLVRVHVPTKRVHPVSIPLADTLNAIAELPGGNGVLVLRARDEDAPGITPTAGPLEPEYLLLNAATGQWRKISGGEFWPFEQETLRPPQPGPKPNTIWVARQDFKLTETKIGIFDTVRRKFTPVQTLPSTLLGPSSFWVQNDEVFAAYAGDLLHFRLAQ